MKNGDKFIPFNRPVITKNEKTYFNEVLQHGKFAGGGIFSQRCKMWLENHFRTEAVFTTTSCTHALEMAALLAEIESGDEVIMPSYAFSSTATAFVQRGAVPVFIDIEPATMNIDTSEIEPAITKKTKAIVALHYAGVSCDMDKIAEIASEKEISVIEDAAQAMFSSYKGKACGTLGDFGCISYHESKNLQCGEGGAIICNDGKTVKRAEIILEKGTNRSQYFRGEIDKYTWVDVGSSYVLSDINCAFLLAQLEHGEEITRDRLKSWSLYQEILQPLQQEGVIELQHIPENCQHNAHIFWLKTKDLKERSTLIEYLKNQGIHSVFHYQPLHSASAGQKYGRFHGKDEYTTKEADRLLRLPMYYGFDQAEYVSSKVAEFYNNR